MQRSPWCRFLLVFADAEGVAQRRAEAGHVEDTGNRHQHVAQREAERSPDRRVGSVAGPHAGQSGCDSELTTDRPVDDQQMSRPRERSRRAVGVAERRKVGSKRRNHDREVLRPTAGHDRIHRRELRGDHSLPRGHLPENRTRAQAGLVQEVDRARRSAGRSADHPSIRVRSSPAHRLLSRVVLELA